MDADAKELSLETCSAQSACYFWQNLAKHDCETKMFLKSK